MSPLPPTSTSPRRLRPPAGQVLRRAAVSIVLATLIAGSLGTLAWYIEPVRWQAGARLIVTEPPVMGDEVEPADVARHVHRQADFAVSPDVLAVAAAELGTDPEDLQDQVSASPVPDTGVLVLQVVAPTPDEAVRVAATVAAVAADAATVAGQADAERALAAAEEARARLAEELAQVTAELDDEPQDSTLQARQETLVARLATLESRLDVLDAAGTAEVGGLEVAEVDARAQQHRRVPWYTPGAAAAIAFAVTILWSLGRTGRLRTAELREQPGEILGAPLLGEIPDFAAAGVSGPDPTRTAPHSAPSEAYQFVVQALAYVLADHSPATVLVTSPGAGAGKSVTSLNLAIAAAQDGRRVLLVDADERVRGLTRSQPVNAEPGLTNLADPAVPFDGCVASLRVSDRLSLPLVPAGSRLADPAGFFRTPGFASAMSRVKHHADVVIVDSPPFMAVSDTSAIAGHCDGIVLVVAQGTPLRLLEDVRERLDLVPTPVLGYVFNRSRPRRGQGDYDRFGYTYGYGYGDERAKRGLVTVENRPGAAEE